MSVYILAKIDITDRQVYAKYEEGFMAIFKRYGGRLLSVDEDPMVLEGTWPETRTVMAEFKDKAINKLSEKLPEVIQLYGLNGTFSVKQGTPHRDGQKTLSLFFKPS